MVRRDKLTSSESVKVRKCCPLNEWLIELDPFGSRECRERNSGATHWKPYFWSNSDLNDESVISAHKPPTSYQLIEGFPQGSSVAVDSSDATSESMCENPFGVIHNHSATLDHIRLLDTGDLAHQLVISSSDSSNSDMSQNTLFHKTISPSMLYGVDDYCIDDLYVGHNESVEGSSRIGDVYDFAYICTNNQINVSHMMNYYVYPIGLSISMLCLILTFLLYSSIPQLRDLSGKFILYICSFLTITFAIAIVLCVGVVDSNVDHNMAEIFQHMSVLGVWVCLNSMGHHIWRIVTAKSVFTRTTDGRKLILYSVFIFSILTLVAVVVLVLELNRKGIQGSLEGDYKEFDVETFLNTGKNISRKSEFADYLIGSSHIGWRSLSVFNICICMLLLLNLYYYLTGQRALSRKLAYNKSIQHFQVNFELYTKFLIVVTIWWICFILALTTSWTFFVIISKISNVAQGPLIFCIAMCRTRVSYLFKNYFCLFCLPSSSKTRRNSTRNNSKQGGFSTLNDADKYDPMLGQATEDDFFLNAAECRELQVIENSMMSAGGSSKSKTALESVSKPFANLVLSTSRRATPVRSSAGSTNDESSDCTQNTGGEETMSGDTNNNNPESFIEDLTKSLFNVRYNPNTGSVPPPPDPDMPVGRIKRLLKSNSLTALNNINFGWRKETSV